MGQMGFYDFDRRLEAIGAKGDPLELIKTTVPWESFRAEIEAVTRPKPEERKSMRFLESRARGPGAGRDHGVAVPRGVGQGRAGGQAVHAVQPASRGQGLYRRGGQIVDATIVSVPVQHNSRSENAAIKVGKTPAGWQEKPAKNAQKDKDARWTKKHDQSFYGYKNHIGIDRTLRPAIILRRSMAGSPRVSTRLI
jgi:IS5 family transposase